MKIIYEWKKLDAENRKYFVCVECGRSADVFVRVKHCQHLFHFCQNHFDAIVAVSKNIYVEVK